MKKLYRVYQDNGYEGYDHIGLIRLSEKELVYLKDRLDSSVYPYNCYQIEEVKRDGWLEINHLRNDINQAIKEANKEREKEDQTPTPYQAFYEKELLKSFTPLITKEIFDKRVKLKEVNAVKDIIKFRKYKNEKTKNR